MIRLLKRLGIIFLGLVLALFVLIIANGTTVSDSAMFVWRFVSNPIAVGSILPSSPHASRALAARIPETGKPRKILEVGAGTGPITPYIIEKLQPGDQLDLIEIDPKLGAVLEEKFGSHPQVSIHIGSVQEWSPGYSYDAIVSTVPFNALPSSAVQEIVDHYKETLLKKEGIFSFIEYVIFPELKKSLLRGEAYKDYVRVRTLIHTLQTKYGRGVRLVYANVPPAYVSYVQFD